MKKSLKEVITETMRCGIRENLGLGMIENIKEEQTIIKKVIDEVRIDVERVSNKVGGIEIKVGIMIGMNNTTADQNVNQINLLMHMMLRLNRKIDQYSLKRDKWIEDRNNSSKLEKDVNIKNVKLNRR
jgi:hypothetical protein